jgi:hypothetical protein
VLVSADACIRLLVVFRVVISTVEVEEAACRGIRFGQ